MSIYRTNERNDFNSLLLSNVIGVSKPMTQATIEKIKEERTKTYTFKVIVEPDEDRWYAYCPILESEGATTWGYTKEEALKNIREVVEMVRNREHLVRKR